MMKKIFTLIIAAFFFYVPVSLYAQSFTIQHDTATSTPSGLTVVEDGITPSAGNMTIQWKVIATNFPSDWLAGTGICDNYQCYANGLLWPGETVETSHVYTNDTLGDFHMQVDLDGATTLGTYYYKVRINNSSIPSDTAIETFVITKNTLTAIPTVKSNDEVVLYPNPAHDEVNVVYDPSLDIKNITVYNVIGKILAVYKVTDNNSANLNLENIPSGIYFLRLVNSHGDIAVTRKFTKQ